MASNENKIQKTLAASIIVLTTVLGTGCGGDSGLDGERLYTENCFKCHGPENQGSPRAGQIDDRSVEAINDAISNDPITGILDMQTLDLQSLDQDEILAISDYLFFIFALNN